MTTFHAVLAADRKGPTYTVRATITAPDFVDASIASDYYDEHNQPRHQTVEARIDRASHMFKTWRATAKHEIILGAA